MCAVVWLLIVHGTITLLHIMWLCVMHCTVSCPHRKTAATLLPVMMLPHHCLPYRGHAAYVQWLRCSVSCRSQAAAAYCRAAVLLVVVPQSWSPSHCRHCCWHCCSMG